MKYEDQQQDKTIEKIRDELNKKVDSQKLLKMAAIIITIVIALSGWFMVMVRNTDDKTVSNKENISEMSGDIKAIRTDVNWLKEAVSGDNREVYIEKFNNISKR